MTKQELIDNTLVLIEKYNTLAKELGKEEEMLINRDYKELFEGSKKCYIGQCNVLILNKYNNLKMTVK